MKWLKYYREKAKLSQRSLAENVGVQENTVWRWENEKAAPSADMVKQLAEFFSCSESELLNGPTQNSWELRLVMRKAEDPQKGVIDMTNPSSNAALYIEDNQMAITLSANYDLWADDEKFKYLIKQLRRKRAIGLRTRNEDW